MQSKVSNRWTEEEGGYLRDFVGLKNYRELSKELGRSENALRLYRQRHNLPTFFDNFYTFNMIANELGKCRTTIRKYYSRGWIKGRKAHWTWAYSKRPMIFLEDNIVTFLKERYYLFNPDKVPHPFFRNIVLEAYSKVVGEKI